jgi:hypothetical protein
MELRNKNTNSKLKTFKTNVFFAGKTLAQSVALHELKFSAGSVEEMQHNFCPIPNKKLADKFIYFYKPYSFNINTSRYMTFDELDDE